MYFFDYLGAFYFWVWLNIWNSVNDTKRPTFKEVLEGKNRCQKGDIVDQSAYGLKLKFIGVVITMIIVSILTKF